MNLIDHNIGWIRRGSHNQMTFRIHRLVIIIEGRVSVVIVQVHAFKIAVLLI